MWSFRPPNANFWTCFLTMMMMENDDLLTCWLAPQVKRYCDRQSFWQFDRNNNRPQGDTPMLIQTSRWHQNKSSFMAWPTLTWPGQNGTFVLMSTGGLNQGKVSPCTLIQDFCQPVKYCVNWVKVKLMLLPNSVIISDCGFNEISQTHLS